MYEGQSVGAQEWAVDSRLVNWGYLGVALAVAVLFAGLISSLDAPTAGGRSSVDAYLNDFGGSREAYEEILAVSDCPTIRDELDRASANHTRTELGSVQHLVTLGYVTAAKDQFASSGCEG